MTRSRQNNDSAASPFVLGHRPALDGLRGLAILAVLLFHTSPPLATGGFIGVEVFFVLSGFLITSLLLAEQQSHGAIDLLRFYLRRGLRLLPALLAVLAALWLFTFFWGSARAVSILRRDSLSILLYVHNWRLRAHVLAPRLLRADPALVALRGRAVLPGLAGNPGPPSEVSGRRLWVVALVVATFLLPVLLPAPGCGRDQPPFYRSTFPPTPGPTGSRPVVWWPC